jgi:TIR domain
MERKKVFISYSWDSEPHKEWVLNLAGLLLSDCGINVVLDQYNVRGGLSPIRFMENASNECDKIIVILTPNYKEKAEKNTGGVGLEHLIISQEFYNSHIDNARIIPVLRSGTRSTSAPGYLKIPTCIDMTDDQRFTDKFEELFLAIHDKSPVQMPPLGNPLDPNNIISAKHPQTNNPLSRAIELKLRKERDQKIGGYINSTEGVNSALIKVRDLIILLENEVKLFQNEANMAFSTRRENYQSLVLSHNVLVAHIYWRYRASNNLDESGLFITMKERPHEGLSRDYGNAIKPAEYSFEFAVDESLTKFSWIEIMTNKPFTDQEIVSLVFNWFVDCKTKMDITKVKYK